MSYFYYTSSSKLIYTMNNFCYALLWHQFFVQVSNLILIRFFLRFYLTDIKLLKHMPQHETLCYAIGRMRFYIPGRKQPLEASKSFIWISAGCCCFEMIRSKKIFCIFNGYYVKWHKPRYQSSAFIVMEEFNVALQIYAFNLLDW